MSPGSRGRRGGKKKKTPARSGVRTQEACDCPACTGQEVDPAQLLGRLLDDIASLAEVEDALDAELAGAALLAVVGAAGDDVLPAVVDAFIPLLESRPGRSSLAVLRALAPVASGVRHQVAEATSAAADRMAAAGVPEPPWGAELAEPVEVADCMRLDGGRGGVAALVASFRRAGRGHAVVIVVDELHCAAAADILLVDADQLPAALDDIRDGFRALSPEVNTQLLDPAELRWYAEEALDARAVHDEEDVVDEAVPMTGDDDDDDGPPYPILAQLVRARLAALPEPRKPKGARGHGHPSGPAPTMLEALASIVGRSPVDPGAGFGGGGLGALRFREPVAAVPARRKKKDGPAPTYQIKVGLRGAKPPIWRRLLVPADMSLADLHDVVQVAFGWHDSHMHVFETPYGDFGRADPQLGHRAEAPVTLEQVAPQAKDKIRYTYDFGDDWEHEIVVEKVLDRDPAASALPLCTGGRRAAPPEDCGGIWGYMDLIEIVGDPGNPDLRERLEWLGLDEASQFDPSAFDVDKVNRALADLR